MIKILLVNIIIIVFQKRILFRNFYQLFGSASLKEKGILLKNSCPNSSLALDYTMHKFSKYLKDFHESNISLN
jgi:hypothetical protein